MSVVFLGALRKHFNSVGFEEFGQVTDQQRFTARHRPVQGDFDRLWVTGHRLVSSKTCQIYGSIRTDPTCLVFLGIG